MSAFLALVVFLAGVYVGSNLRSTSHYVVERIVVNPNQCATVGQWIQRYEELIKPYRELLPYRLEEGNYDPKLLDRYEFMLYQYYVLYRDSWKTCKLDPPVLYIAPRGAVRCGQLLDRLKEKHRFVVFPFIVDENIETSVTLTKYYNFRGKPLLVICGREVNCDERSIIDALESC